MIEGIEVDERGEGRNITEFARERALIGRAGQDFPSLKNRYGDLEGAKAKCEASANADSTSVEV